MTICCCRPREIVLKSGKSRWTGLGARCSDALVVVPGSSYGNSTELFVRLSIGTESEERIWEALQVFKIAINSKVFEPVDHEAKLKALQLSG